MKRSSLRRKSKSEVAQAKDRIQGLLRQIVIARDGGCILRKENFWHEENSKIDTSSIPLECNGYRNDGELILQADHLNSRQHSASYGLPDLVVCLCLAHHGWKSVMSERKKDYDRVVKILIGEKRAKLWEKIEADRRPHPMTLSDWTKCEIALRAELKNLTT